MTTFNRGTKATPEGARSITGDRLAEGGYKNLDGLEFDTVVDTWAYDPVAVRSAVAALKGRFAHYIYISSIAVYNQETSSTPLTEKTPLIDLKGINSQYADDKRRGEIATEGLGVPVLWPRPGIILGPWEGIPGRLPWWLKRFERGGRTLAPGPKDNDMQYIDVRDLAKFVIDGAEDRLSGEYNILSQPHHTTIPEYLNDLNDVTGNHAELIWKTPEEILAGGVEPWRELPCWLPPGRLHDMTFGCDVGKAFAKGLRARPSRATIEDTWAWMQTLDEEPPATGGVGLNPEKEAKIIG